MCSNYCEVFNLNAKFRTMCIEFFIEISVVVNVQNKRMAMAMATEFCQHDSTVKFSWIYLFGAFRTIEC